MQLSQWLESPFTADTLALLSSAPLEQKKHPAVSELQAAHGREAALRRAMGELGQRQVMLTQELQHRLVNGLQVISSLLSLQSRKAKTSEAANQLAVAAGRVAALGRVHRQLHLLDHEDRVEFKRYLEQLCEDLSRLLCEESGDCAIVVEGTHAEIPAAFAIPLGFIVNELITNAAKHAKGTITVRFEESAPGCHSLSVSDAGSGLPAGFDPGDSKGLGMRIVQALLKQIGGELHICGRDHGRGARFTVAFQSRISVQQTALAPPFRDSAPAPVESLAEALSEGMVRGHQNMPEFRLDPGQAGDFIDFLKSL